MTILLMVNFNLQSPFTPFICEHMYQNLRSLFEETSMESVHYLMLPEPRYY